MPVGQVGDAHRRFGLVDVLAARARGAIRVDAAVALVDVDLDAVVDHRIDPNAREARVPARVRIERRDAHQPMHARFGLQPAVGVMALDHDRRRLDARLVAGRLFDDLDIELAALRPAHVHAQEHARPVGALGAARARMDLDIAVVAVRFARQERLELTALALGLQGLQGRHALGLGRFVALDLAELDQRRRVLEVALESWRASPAGPRAACARASPSARRRRRSRGSGLRTWR